VSGLAGIVRFDGAPVAPAALDAMVATMPHRHPDGVGTWLAGPVALAHLRLRTTASADGPQPVADPSAQVCLAFDGRIDDREGLGRRLGYGSAALRDRSAPELVLHAYLRWGAAGLAHVVGEFAVAIWDGRRHELLLARDFLGKRPLLYHHGPTGVRWASELQAVLCDPAVTRTPNIGMVGEHLALRQHSRTETLFTEVLRVPPAHVLRFADGTVRAERHWDWDRSPIRRRPDREHIEELADTLQTAVAAALDAPGPVAAELSGGLDSSSVAAVADRLLRTGRATGPLELMGLVFPGQVQDETVHIRRVAEHLGRPVAELEPTPAGAEHYCAQIEHHLDLPEPPNMAMHRSLHALARARGARVVLTGKGSDERFTGSPYVYADALRTGRLVTAWRLARSELPVWGARSWLHQLARDGVHPMLPDRIAQAGERLLGKAGRLPAWMPPAFWARHDLADRTRPDPLPGPSHARAQVARTLGLGSEVLSTESSERTLARAGLEARSPFDDRRVVEVALALPEDLRRRGFVSKWAVREAMRGLLPEENRTRLDKADFRGVLHDELAAQGGGTLFRDLAVADLGWVDAAVARDLWARAEARRSEGAEITSVWPLWIILSTERWVRAIF
jgi:asparagine synthase (glutamine-hydrolysing)